MASLMASAGLMSGCSTGPTTPPIAAPAPPKPKPLPPALPRKIQLSDLARYSPSDVEAIFGAPSLKRSEGETTVLQFTSTSCITDMVFNKAANLIHVVARAKSGTPIEIQPCLDSFSQTLPSTTSQPEPDA